ncbi:unnamed protein product, partial [Laminaria digitata]
GLIRTLNQGEVTATDRDSTNGSHSKKSTVPELREECRRRGLRNFWNLRKAGLLSLLKGEGEVTAADITSKNSGRRSTGPTVQELRDECRRRGLRNYGKLRKAELILLLKEHPLAQKGPQSRDERN